MAKLKELLGKRIKEMRIARNMTQEQLAELIDIASTSISKIENGLYHPTDENLEKIAKAFNVPAYKLYICEHNRTTSELKNDINNMLNNASDEEVKLIYKILNGIFA